MGVGREDGEEEGKACVCGWFGGGYGGENTPRQHTPPPVPYASKVPRPPGLLRGRGVGKPATPSPAPPSTPPSPPPTSEGRL